MLWDYIIIVPSVHCRGRTDAVVIVIASAMPAVNPMRVGTRLFWTVLGCV